MKPYAKKFYNSTSWTATRNAYFKYKLGMCERCNERGTVSAGEIVHHIIHINTININNPNITLDFNNLMLVCRECHKKIHDGDNTIIKEGLTFNENGDIEYEIKDIL